MTNLFQRKWDIASQLIFITLLLQSCFYCLWQKTKKKNENQLHRAEEDLQFSCRCSYKRNCKKWSQCCRCKRRSHPTETDTGFDIPSKRSLWPSEPSSIEHPAAAPHSHPTPSMPLLPINVFQSKNILVIKNFLSNAKFRVNPTSTADSSIFLIKLTLLYL